MLYVLIDAKFDDELRSQLQAQPGH